MKKEKTPMTAEQLYKQNKKKMRVFRILTPIAWYLFLGLTLLFLCLAFKNSIGNVTEVLGLLDKENHSAAEVRENYQALVEKWGEWELVGENSAGIAIRYVDIRSALFSGLMITFTTLSIVFFLCAIIFGKIIFPMLAKHYESTNGELVDMATLKSAEQIDAISKSRKEWF